MFQYAGIPNAQKIGQYYVDDAARTVKRLAYIHYRLSMIGAAQLPARMNWHFKAGLARHLYEDSQATKGYMRRASELRSPQTQKMKEPDPWIALFFDELLMARSDYELWVGIYEIVKPEIITLIKRYIDSTQPLVDYPTVRFMKTVLMDLEDQLTWAAAIKPILLEDAAFFRQHADKYQVAADDETSAEEYRKDLRHILSQAGGLGSFTAPEADKAPVRKRSLEAYQIPKVAVRDPRMGGETLGRTGVKNPPQDAVLADVVASARTRQEELGAAELCAAAMVLQTDMPWEFYEDLARHCWDEMRHTLFGQAVLDFGGYDWYSQPQFKGDYDPHMNKPISTSYVWLSIGIEGSAMRKNGMPKEARDLRKLAEQTSDPFVTLFAQCVDFDWADEVTHHQYGRKWAEELIGDYRTAERIADREMKLNFTRMAKDTLEYWQGKEGGEKFIKDWLPHMDPERLKEIEKNS